MRREGTGRAVNRGARHALQVDPLPERDSGGQAAVGGNRRESEGIGGNLTCQRPRTAGTGRGCGGGQACGAHVCLQKEEAGPGGENERPAVACPVPVPVNEWGS